MEETAIQPEIIDKLRFATDAFLAAVAGMQLDIYTPLKDGPKSAEEIAQATGVGTERLRLLLYALVVGGLLTERDGRFSNTAEAQRFLVKDSPFYMGNRYANYSARMAYKLQIAESIRAGVPKAKIDFSKSSPKELEMFLRRINLNSVAAGKKLIETYGVGSTGCLADVGCGGAGLAITLTKRYPNLRATAIDLPEITPLTEKFVQEEGMSDRIKVLAADALSGPLPGAYDVVLLRAVVQVLSPQDARLAIKNIGAAVNPGGTIYIIGQILDDSRTSPLEAVGFNLSFITLFDAGESYTEQEYKEWLSEAGFIDIERANFLLPDGDGIMIACKPI